MRNLSGLKFTPMTRIVTKIQTKKATNLAAFFCPFCLYSINLASGSPHNPGSGLAVFTQPISLPLASNLKMIEDLTSLLLQFSPAMFNCLNLHNLAMSIKFDGDKPKPFFQDCD